MAVSNAVGTWTLQMAAGSVQDYTFTFESPGQFSTTPYPISGATWEYVVRATPTAGGTAVISLTTSPNTQGFLSVTATASLSQVLMTLYPSATASLAPATYYHALWQNPSSGSAYTWFTGLLQVQGNPQP